MIAVDTYVLLRRILADDVQQARKAQHLFDAKRPILVTDIVLVEALWTLAGKRFGAQPEDIENVVISLLEEPNIVFESKQAVWSALEDFMTTPMVKTANGNKRIDFAHALIVNKAKVVMAQTGNAYDGTYTFDSAALAVSGTKAP